MCTFGLVNPPRLSGIMPLYQERATQHTNGELTFCGCRAGAAMRRFLIGSLRDEQERADHLASEPQRAAQRRLERMFTDAGVPERYARMTFDGFMKLAGNDPEKRMAVTTIKEYFESGPKSADKPGVYLYGKPAMGKTGALSPLFVHLVRHGSTGIWLQYNELMAEMRRFEDGNVDARMDACKSVDYLFIDDLGDPAANRAATDYARDVLFRIIDFRASNSRAMFITSNLAPAEIAEQFHARIARRITSACVAVAMGGKVLT